MKGERNALRAQAHHTICQTQRRQCYGMGLYGCQRNWVTGVNWWCECWLSGMKSERATLSAHIQPNPAKPIGRCFSTGGQWTQNMLGKKPKSFSRQINEIFFMGIICIESLYLKQIDHAFHLMKTTLKPERPTKKQPLEAAAVKTWQSISRERN